MNKPAIFPTDRIVQLALAAILFASAQLGVMAIAGRFSCNSDKKPMFDRGQYVFQSNRFAYRWELIGYRYDNDSNRAYIDTATGFVVIVQGSENDVPSAQEYYDDIGPEVATLLTGERGLTRVAHQHNTLVVIRRDGSCLVLQMTSHQMQEIIDELYKTPWSEPPILDRTLRLLDKNDRDLIAAFLVSV